MAGIDTKREPFQKILSENVIVYYGWKDSHAIVRVRLPIPLHPWYSVQIPAEAILKFKNNFEDACRYGLKPAEERTMEAPLEFEARDDCRGRWGYPDGHVELGVKRVIWFWLKFPFEEFILAKKAMDEAHQWAQMPEEIRQLQGLEP